MDNLTHSLIGAVLGQAGLKRKTGLAMPTLIIAANLPDIDASCTVLGMVSLAMRRGITHGPIAMLVLPLLLTGAMVAFDRRQARRGTRPADRPEVRPGWLLALAYIGCLTHPLFDWMNSYGIRLLEPFSHRWFYGDALFIVDPWLWGMLIAGVWVSRRREKALRADWRRPADAAIVGAAAYVVLNLGISAQAVSEAKKMVPVANEFVANPTPLTFWRRSVLVRAVDATLREDAVVTRPSFYESYDSEPFGKLERSSGRRPTHMYDLRIAEQAKGDAVAEAFLFWSRMPVAEKDGNAITLKDQRFMDNMTGNSFQVRLEP